MALSDEDALVEAIATRVAQRLSGAMMAPAASPPRLAQVDAGATDPCTYAAEGECNGCGFCVTRKEDIVFEMLRMGISRVSAGPGGAKPDGNIAGMIDHTILKNDATKEQLKKVCDEARQWGFATVCVNAVNIPFVARELAGCSVKPIAVVGFPLGAMTPMAKAFETREAVRFGAKEIDMVINIGALKGRDYTLVLTDIVSVVQAAKPYPVKVILETGSLTRDEKVIACSLSKCAGAAFVKTSTGFGPGGATVEDIALMRSIVGPEIGVKASGGVRDTEIAQSMIKAGANRIGASASIAIVTGAKSDSKY
jgi:deoxyribose-phosphate aldolase